jgi:hypothetical protein
MSMHTDNVLYVVHILSCKRWQLYIGLKSNESMQSDILSPVVWLAVIHLSIGVNELEGK